MLGFMYCISFHCSIDGVDAFFEGGERRAGVAVDGSDPFAADQPIRRAGSKKKNCTTIFCHHLEEAFI